MKCTDQYLNTCEDHLGHVTASLARPYINVLQNIFSKACEQGMKFERMVFASDEIRLRFIF